MSNLPTWNLADFYPSFKSKLISDDLNTLQKSTISFQKKFKNKLQNLSQDELLNSLKKYEEGIVTVSLQGACSGCPSSSQTLKGGIEGLLKKMMPKEVIEVVADND